MSAIPALIRASLPVLLLVTATSDARSAAPRAVSEAEAQALVTAYLADTGATTRPKFGLDRVPEPRRGAFFVFEATADSGPEASVVIGHYAVDRRTGDVWDAVSCAEYRSDSLADAQRELRAGLGLPERAYRRKRRSGPMC